MKNLVWIPVMILGLLVACSDDEDNDVQPANEVWMSDTSFLPANLIVPVGTTVRWVNTSSIAHTVTSSKDLFDEHLEADGDFSYTFTETGTFNYVCIYHPGMIGKITVE